MKKILTVVLVLASVVCIGGFSGTREVQAKGATMTADPVYTNAKQVKYCLQKKISKKQGTNKTYRVKVTVKRAKKVLVTKKQYLKKSAKGTYRTVKLGIKLKKGDKVTITLQKKKVTKTKKGKKTTYVTCKDNKKKAIKVTVTVKDKKSNGSQNNSNQNTNQNNNQNSNQNNQGTNNNLTVEDIKDGEEYEADGGYYDNNDDGTFKILAARVTKDGTLHLKWANPSKGVEGYVIRACGSSVILEGDSANVTSGVFSSKDTTDGTVFEPYIETTVRIQSYKLNAGGKGVTYLDDYSVKIKGDYLVEYENWRKEVINGLDSSLSTEDKVVQIAHLIRNQFRYGFNGDPAEMYATGLGNCIAGNGMLVEFCRDMGLQAELVSVGYRYGNDHYVAHISIDGELLEYDATPIQE